ncbi:replication protein a 70 kda DNA-binding subunit a [Anaeramoeba ignava]|uniref:Replication protein a 70 kDa DNA-binding subunit a n=1 Tax=Anaeramoeba ignava TaxID=1746090 RepID=A0A9Q0R7Q7_ANAIG|nr:replication protein a 70 kda DNA-binding subunit a [Anaeramoeba ignava]
MDNLNQFDCVVTNFQTNEQGLTVYVSSGDNAGTVTISEEIRERFLKFVQEGVQLRTLLDTSKNPLEIVDFQFLDPQIQQQYEQQIQQQYPEQQQQQQPQQQQQQQPQQQYQQQQQYQEQSEDIDGHVTPFKSINPIDQNFLIKARIISKSEIGTFSNTTREGRMCSINLIDEEGSEMKATMFDDSIDKFYEQIEEDSVYYIKNGKMKINNSPVQTTIFQMTFSNRTVMQKCEDDGSIPKMTFSFTPIGKIKELKSQTLVDIIGILIEMGNLENLTTKDGRAVAKRRLVLIDQTSKIEVTLWKKSAEKVEDLIRQHQTPNAPNVIAIKRGKVAEFNGKYININDLSQIFWMPNCPEAKKLIQDSMQIHNQKDQMESLSGGEFNWYSHKRILISDIPNVGKGKTESETVIISGVLAHVQHKNIDRLFYPSCINKNCNKKVQEREGGWYCPKCNQIYPKCGYRFMSSVCINDFSDSYWCTIFDNQAQKIFMTTAEKMRELILNSSQLEIQKYFEKFSFQKFLFRIQLKSDFYQDEEKIKATITGSCPLNEMLIDESKYLIENIKKRV